MNIVCHKYSKLIVFGLFSVTFAICLTMFACCGYVNRGWIAGPDAQGYYMVGRSLYFDHDVDFTNERQIDPRSEQLGAIPHLTEIGRISNHSPIGYALLAQPAFLLADVVTRSTNNLLRITLPNDGYRGVFGVLVPFSTLIYGFIGMYLAYRIIIMFFDKVIAALSITITILSTSLLWYITGQVTMVHIHSFAALSALMYCMMPFFKKDISGIGTLRYICVGCFLALATMIRMQNAIFALVPIVAMGQHLLIRKSGGDRKFLLDLIVKIFIGAFTTFISFTPQMLYCKAIYGSYFKNTYGTTTGWGFHFLRPELAKTLFSAEHGLFIWHPVTLVSCIGICLLFSRVKNERLFILLLSVCFILTWYIVSSWDYTMANSFGSRAFDGSTVFFALGLAETLNRLWKRKKIVISMCVILILWNMQLLIQQRYFKWLPIHGRGSSYLQMFTNYNKLPDEWKRIKMKYFF